MTQLAKYHPTISASEVRYSQDQLSMAEYLAEEEFETSQTIETTTAEKAVKTESSRQAGAQPLGNQAKKEKKAKPVKPVLPGKLMGTAGAGLPFKELLRRFGREYLKVIGVVRWHGPDVIYAVTEIGLASSYTGSPDDGDCLMMRKQEKRNKYCPIGTAESFTAEAKLLFVADDMTVWSAMLILPELQYTTQPKPYGSGGGMQYSFHPFDTSCYRLSEWKTETGLVSNPTWVQTESEIEHIIEMNNPKAAEFVRNYAVSPFMYILAPQLEQLYKAGFAFASDFFGPDVLRDDSLLACFNRLTKRGNNLKEIFKTGKPVYTALKNCCRMELWDSIRKMEKCGKLTPDSILTVLDSGYSEKQLKAMSSILNKTSSGKQIFSWVSLCNYLRRLDINEAIEIDEGLMLLTDYLDMCSRLGMRPRIDSDSLKREHDIAARLSRQYYSESEREAVDKACSAGTRFDYYEKAFFIRHIKGYDELFAEAKAQHNCLASYGKRIADGQSLIFVMRETSAPNRSLITVELSPDGKTVRQALCACNRQISNRAQSEFLERWNRYCVGIRTGSAK